MRNMGWNTKERKVQISVSEDGLEALEDVLVAWNLCRKHKAKAFDFKAGRELTEQEIFKMQNECKNCIKYNRQLRRKAIGVMGKLFRSFDRQYGHV